MTSRVLNMHYTMFSSISTFIFTFLLITGCNIFNSGNSENKDNFDENIINRQWQLEAIKSNNGKVVLVPDTEWTYSVKFNEIGKVEGKNACNHCNGQYELKSENKISINVSCTEMVCGNPAPYLGYGDALNHASSFEIDSGRLNIFFTPRGGEEQILVHISSN